MAGLGVVKADVQDQEEGIWWCNTHQRPCTYQKPDGEWRCDGKQAGIMMPCVVVFAPVKIIDQP